MAEAKRLECLLFGPAAAEDAIMKGVLDFVGGTAGDGKKLGEFGITQTSESLGDISIE